ncbi:Palmitoleoyl-protein carboxylesterase notum1a [Trichinella spiralis]|uniref:Palmitoleoyl-protein carboxylesterase notum1a n=1 Tax=Trichinella spiralis TaxID=6334 RepID=A0ABR3L409_TRISP
MENVVVAAAAAADDDDEVLNRHAPMPTNGWNIGNKRVQFRCRQYIDRYRAAESWLVSNGMRYWLWKRTTATPEANKSRRALPISIVRCPLVVVYVYGRYLPSKERRESMSAIARDRHLPSSYVDDVD